MSATDTAPPVDRSVLPIAPAPFKGTIGLRSQRVHAVFPSAVTARTGRRTWC